jgi:hypothetical protein
MACIPTPLYINTSLFITTYDLLLQLLRKVSNKNAISQSDELRPLSEAGLVQIDFNKDQTVSGEFFGKEQYSK